MERHDGLYRLDEDSILERDGVRLVLPAGTEIRLPDGAELQPEQPHTKWRR